MNYEAIFVVLINNRTNTIRSASLKQEEYERFIEWIEDEIGERFV